MNSEPSEHKYRPIFHFLKVGECRPFHDALRSFFEPWPLTMTDFSSLITEIAAIPIISSGTFTDNFGEKIQLYLNVRKYCGDISKKSNYLWRSDGPLTETNGEIKFRSLSPNSRTLLVGRSSGEKDVVIEIWEEGGQRFSSLITVSSIHGDFCTDGKKSINYTVF